MDLVWVKMHLNSDSAKQIRAQQVGICRTWLEQWLTASESSIHTSKSIHKRNWDQYISVVCRRWRAERLKQVVKRLVRQQAHERLSRTGCQLCQFVYRLLEWVLGRQWSQRRVSSYQRKGRVGYTERPCSWRQGVFCVLELWYLFCLDQQR